MSVNLCAKSVSKRMKEHRFECGWFLLPVFLGISSIIGMMITYMLAKKNCHIQQWRLPYISYTGTEMPESTVFGLLLNLEGFLGFVVVIIAWRVQRHIGENHILGQATLICGLVSCLGVIMVGNFPVSKLKVPHYIGAGLAFMVGTVYCGLASWLCYKVIHKIPERLQFSTVICALRITATVIMLISTVTGLFTQIRKKDFKNEYGRAKLKEELGSRHDWRYPNGTCITIIDKVPAELQALDLVGSLSEWLLTGCLLFFLSLYAYEFKAFKNVKIILRAETGSLLNISNLHRKCSLRGTEVTSPSTTCGATSSSDISRDQCCHCSCHNSFETDNRNDGVNDSKNPKVDFSIYNEQLEVREPLFVHNQS